KRCNKLMRRPVEAARPHKVAGFWFLVRRVPAEFAAYDTRKLVRQSTGIRIADDPRAVRAAKSSRSSIQNSSDTGKTIGVAATGMAKRDMSKPAIARAPWVSTTCGRQMAR